MGPLAGKQTSVGKSGNSIENSLEPFTRGRKARGAMNRQTGAAISVNIVASRYVETCERMRWRSTESLWPVRPNVCYSVYRIRTGSLVLYLRFTSGSVVGLDDIRHYIDSYKSGRVPLSIEGEGIRILFPLVSIEDGSSPLVHSWKPYKGNSIFLLLFLSIPNHLIRRKKFVKYVLV